MTNQNPILNKTKVAEKTGKGGLGAAIGVAIAVALIKMYPELEPWKEVIIIAVSALAFGLHNLIKHWEKWLYL